MAKRKRIDARTDKRDVRRDERGRFVGSDEVARRRSADRLTVGLVVAVIAGVLAVTAGALIRFAPPLARGTTRLKT